MQFLLHRVCIRVDKESQGGIVEAKDNKVEIRGLGRSTISVAPFLSHLLLIVLLPWCFTWPTASAQKPTDPGKLDEKNTQLNAQFKWLSYLGGAELSADDWASLRNYFQSVDSRGPNEVFPSFVDGQLARSRRQFGLAEASFSKGVKAKDPRSVIHWLGLAETALDQQDTTKAILYLDNVNFEDSKDVPADWQHLLFAKIGDLYETAGNYTKAIVAYESAVTKNPDWTLGLRKLARAYLWVNSPAKALPFMEKAIASKPQEAENHYVLGRLQSQAGNSSLAIKSFQRAVELNQGDVFYHYVLGLEYERTGQKKAALNEYSTAQDLARKDDKKNGYLLDELKKALDRTSH